MTSKNNHTTVAAEEVGVRDRRDFGSVTEACRRVMAWITDDLRLGHELEERCTHFVIEGHKMGVYDLITVAQEVEERGLPPLVPYLNALHSVAAIAVEPWYRAPGKVGGVTLCVEHELTVEVYELDLESGCTPQSFTHTRTCHISHGDHFPLTPGGWKCADETGAWCAAEYEDMDTRPEWAKGIAVRWPR